MLTFLHKNDLKAAHSVRKAVDLEICDEAVAKTDKHEDSTEIEDADTVVIFENLERREHKFSVRNFDRYDFKHGDCMSVGNSKEEVYNSARMLARKFSWIYCEHQQIIGKIQAAHTP